jgi:hypothetical protein
MQEAIERIDPIERIVLESELDHIHHKSCYPFLMAQTAHCGGKINGGYSKSLLFKKRAVPAVTGANFEQGFSPAAL